MNNYKINYYEYLKKRSIIGLLYRKYILYPSICKHLNGHVLDIGCGIGDFLKFRANTVGVDINEETVRHCCKLGLNAQVMIENILPFEAKRFDAIVLDNVLEHIIDPTLLLIEISRVLKQNGKLLVGVPGIKGYKRDPDHKIFYDLQKLIKLMNHNNLSYITHFYQPIIFANLSKIISQHSLYSIFVLGD
jgi:SAM-dependent methyltransferase